MAIDAVGSSAMTYQGGVSAAAKAPAQQVKTESTAVEIADTDIAQSADRNAAQQSARYDGEQGSESNQQGSASEEQIRKAVDEMNKKMTNSEAIFGVHEKTNRITIKIVDKETKKVIKELPPEKTLDMIAKVWEMAGILVDEKR